MSEKCLRPTLKCATIFYFPRCRSCSSIDTHIWGIITQNIFIPTVNLQKVCSPPKWCKIFHNHPISSTPVIVVDTSLTYHISPAPVHTHTHTHIHTHFNMFYCLIGAISVLLLISIWQHLGAPLCWMVKSGHPPPPQKKTFLGLLLFLVVPKGGHRYLYVMPRSCDLYGSLH